MKRILRFLVRAGLFLALLFGLDQVVLHTSLDVAGIREVRTFYVDFRHRLLTLGGEPDTPSIETAIERSEAPEDKPTGAAPSPRYLYADDQGQLHFADNLEQIPLAYRQQAQRLEE